MYKLNGIKVNKTFKIIFYILTIITIAIFFSLNVILFLKPHFIQHNYSLSLGSYVSVPLVMINNHYSGFCNFNLDVGFIISYSFGLVSFCLMCIFYFYINFSKWFMFDTKKYKISSSLIIVICIFLIILTSCISFIKPIKEINFYINSATLKVNAIFDYAISKHTLLFSFNASGIACLFFFCLETIILFSLIIFFSYKIIKKKYI